MLQLMIIIKILLALIKYTIINTLILSFVKEINPVIN